MLQYSDSIVKKCIASALQGDQSSMRLCMERLGAPQRETRVKLKMPIALTVEEVKQSLASTIEAVTSGRITPGQGESITRMLEGQCRVIESTDVETRVGKLENLTVELKDK